MRRRAVKEYPEIIDTFIEGVGNVEERDYDYIGIYWKNQDGEFGHIGLYSHDDGNIEIDSEYMSKDFVKKVFNKLVDNATIREVK